MLCRGAVRRGFWRGWDLVPPATGVEELIAIMTAANQMRTNRPLCETGARRRFFNPFAMN